MVIDNYKSNYIIVNIVLTWSNLRILGLFKELKFSPNNKSPQEKLLQIEQITAIDTFYVCKFVFQLQNMIKAYDSGYILYIW